MTKYKVSYKSYVVTSNTAIRRNNFTCITFENIGTDPAVLDNSIPLVPQSGEARMFNEKPYVVIDHQFEIRFAGESTDQQILVIEAYYREAYP